MKSRLLYGTAAAALMAVAQPTLFIQPASANTLVASIIGAYDAECTSTCVSAPGITNYASNGGNSFDTPSLFILNPTSTAFTNVTVNLTGYQDAAGGGTGVTYMSSASSPATLTLTLPNIGANTVYQLIWGAGGVTESGANGLNLFAYDYDDELGNIAGSGASDPAGHHCGTNDTNNPNICNFTGNFDVAFSAMLGTTPISSDFSPDSTQDGGNVAGSFVGWEGLDIDGLSETAADTHTNTFPGTLANIYTGTNQSGGGGTSVPEPSSLAIITGGLGALGALAFVRRRRKASVA